MPGDVEEKLAGEPAAAELVALAARVRTADPGGVRASAEQVRAIGDGLEHAARAVDRAVTAVGGRWQGRSADVFADWSRAFGEAADRDRQALAEAGAALAHVGAVLDDLRGEVDQQVARALDRLRSARARAASTVDAPPELPDLLARDALRAPTDAARAAVALAEADLRAAAARIRGLAEDLTAYADLSDLDLPSPREPGVHTREGHGPAPSGRVGDWIRQAVAILRDAGVPPDRMDPRAIATIIERESGGDPEAVNDDDVNAARGTPSQGLMQTIGPTFEAHKLPGHDDIRDPVDNIIAGVRYAIDRYGSVSRVPGVLAVARGDPYVGY
ncbi:MAG TPA: transglycosylase SLT domain-containing protein [Actinomycetospora sp.]|nr:transglycosylase SLT domain-containing protein [Actinomycetospora sp.]